MVSGLGVVLLVVWSCMKCADVVRLIGMSMVVIILKNISSEMEAVVVMDVVSVLRTAVRSYYVQNEITMS